MNKQYIVIAVIILSALIGALLPSCSPPPLDDGSGGIRQPTVLIPDSISVARYYDEESDVLCWIFTKELAGGGYDVTSACLPREVTGY